MSTCPGPVAPAVSASAATSAPPPVDPSTRAPETAVAATPTWSAEARRIASTILEVMAGMRSITEAALALGISTPRYQALELRAVAGLIAACEPRPPGSAPGAALPGDCDRLRAERDRLRQEVARYQTLLRISREAFGQPAAADPAAISLPGRTQRAVASARRAVAAATAGVRPRKKRQATVRALRLAKRVREAPGAASAGGASTAPPERGMPGPTAEG